MVIRDASLPRKKSANNAKQVGGNRMNKENDEAAKFPYSRKSKGTYYCAVP